MAAALRNELEREDVYLADVDALQGREPQWRAIRDVARHLPQMWLDVGVRDESDLAELVRTAANHSLSLRPIVALESLRSLTALRQITQFSMWDDCVFSLDLRDAALVTAIPEWRETEPCDVVKILVDDFGLRRLLVLDVASVGVGRGVSTLPLCQRLVQQFPQLEVATGGGVRHDQDLREIEQTGCHAALVGSALHDRQLLRSTLEAGSGRCNVESQERRDVLPARSASE